MSSCDIDKTNPRNYYFNYIGNETDINNDDIFKNFDTNYINLNMFPFNFYPIYNKNYYDTFINKHFGVYNTNIPTPTETESFNNIKNEFETIYKNMKNEKLIYNKYLITPITITITIIWIFILLFILKFIHYSYNLFYIYFISTIIILLLIFGSLWFLYVNSQLL